MACHMPCQGGMKGLGGHLLPWQAATRLYIWSLLAKRESITFLALLLSRSIPLSLSFPFVLYCLSLACSPPHPFHFLWYVVLTSKWQRILILAELSAQSAGIKPGLRSRFVPLRKWGGKWEKEKREAEKDRNGWESWLKMMPPFEKNKNVSKQCLSSLSKVKVYNHLIISLALCLFCSIWC